MASKSPFYVIPEFISPLMCEEILDICDFIAPDKDKDLNPILTIKSSERAESLIYERLLLVLPEVQAHYQILYKGTEPIYFEWYPQGCKGECHAENSNYVRSKWLRTKNRDITGVLFLTEYQDQIPYEQDYEVYGGKLEFPQHHFGFNPQRGTLIFFPSDPHFINGTSDVFVGDAFQARIQIAAQTPYLYDPQMFPGNYTTWFADKL